LWSKYTKLSAGVKLFLENELSSRVEKKDQGILSYPILSYPILSLSYFIGKRMPEEDLIYDRPKRVKSMKCFFNSIIHNLR
jgi:hypothetical protein